MTLHWPPRFARGWETLFTVLVILVMALLVAWVNGWIG